MKKSKLNSIPTEVYRSSQLTQASVKAAPKGTNLALYEGLMTMMSGRMLESCGALIPALAHAGFDQCDSMRIWQGLAHGAWEVNTILAALNAQIAQERVWRALEVGGYQVKVLDTMGFFRPHLKGCATKH